MGGSYPWEAAGLYKGEVLRQAGLSNDMYYQSVFRGRFLDRPNRFIAHVEMGSGVETVHVKNTGRCRELLVPGAVVYLEQGTNPARKTRYDLIAVEKGKRLINMDAQAPNKVFSEWAAAGGFLPEVSAIRPEFRYGDSRLDFCLETPQGPQLVEVKGVTLEENGRCRFPDAPTERGRKHLDELALCMTQGYQGWLCFVVQMDGMESVSPNDVTDPAFGAALRRAAQAGVRIRAFGCQTTPDSLTIVKELPVQL
jgi:sugar fermentation stimulation protein A